MGGRGEILLASRAAKATRRWRSLGSIAHSNIPLSGYGFDRTWDYLVTMTPQCIVIRNVLLFEHHMYDCSDYCWRGGHVKWYDKNMGGILCLVQMGIKETKQLQMEGETSDAGAFGLEALGAEFSAVDRQTTLDDMASQNWHHYDLPLQAASVKCKACAEDSRTVLLFTIRELSRHIAWKRSDARVVWNCAQCRNGYLKLHATECHIPKFKVVFEMPQASAWEQCPKCLASQYAAPSTKGTHTRNLGNKQVEKQPKRGPGRTPTVWTTEELALLIESNDRFQGNRIINMKILEFLLGKTRRKISDKRAHMELARTGARRVALETDTSSQVAPVSDVIVSEDTYTLVQHPDDVSASQENALLDELSEDLQRGFTVRCNCHNISSFAGLEHMLAQLTNSVRVENINTVICEFVSMLKGDEDTRSPRTANRHAKRRNHNALRRFRYAKCQEAYHKCPCKLVDMTIVGSNVFLPRIEPPESGQIQELYEQVWGTTGPECVLPRKGNASNEIGVMEMLAPIREEEVILK